MRRNKNVQYRELTQKRRFGVELEINNSVDGSKIRKIIKNHSERKIKTVKWAQSRDNNYWHIKRDVTCGIIGKGYDKGWEVASFVGSGENDIYHIGTVAQALADGGCEVNRNCGLHVHVEVDDFDAYQMGILLGHYVKFEWVLLRITPDYRHDNPYCDTFYFSVHERHQYWSPPEMWLLLSPRNFSSQNNLDRWQSVNLVNFAVGLANTKWNRKTIEFRLPECSLMEYDVKNWIRLFINFVDWAKNQDMPDNIEQGCLENSLAHMGLHHDDNGFYLFDKALFNAKTWLLRRFLRFNKYDKESKMLLDQMWHPVRDF